MKRLVFLLIILLNACKSDQKNAQDPESLIHERPEFSQVEVQILLEDSMSIRAIEIMGEDLAFAGASGMYGIYNAAQEEVRVSRQAYDTIYPEFRAVASSGSDFFMLSVANPALLYKTGDQGEMELVYQEAHEKVFYDAMSFWNEQEGIAMGDPVDNCLSVIITRDGGRSWEKLPCTELPEAAEGEAAFAASNANIAIQGDHTWLLSGGALSRVYYSPDKGRTWEVFNTPLLQGESTQGGYAIDFYDAKNGVIIGGDYTDPNDNKANKAITSDGGKTWQLLSPGEGPGYKSSIRYVPGSKARELVAVGFTGISYSADQGQSWKEISTEGFYTLRFLNDTTAYAAGKNRLAKLKFK